MNIRRGVSSHYFIFFFFTQVLLGEGYPILVPLPESRRDRVPSVRPSVRACGVRRRGERGMNPREPETPGRDPRLKKGHHEAPKGEGEDFVDERRGEERGTSRGEGYPIRAPEFPWAPTFPPGT